MKNINKSLSLVLAFVLLLSVFPFNVVYAVEENTASTQTQQTEEFVLPDIVPEAESAERGYIGRAKEEEKDNFTFVFKNSDNTRTMRVYSHPVKYTDDDGNIKDITLDIQSRAGGGFETKDNSIKTTFGAKLSDGIRLQHENVDIKLIPANKNITPVLSEDKQTVTYTLDTKTSLEYSLTYMGFKEDIVVSEYTGQTEYEFLLYTNGLTVKEEMGSYYLADSEGNRKANIGDIIIFTADERNNTLGSLSCIEIKENQIYGLTIHVDEEYLKDEKTVYPIRIDPTFEITSATTEGAIEDVTVYTGTEYYSGTSGILYAGIDSGKIYRILMRFPNLDLSDISADQITSATVELRDVMCQSTPVMIECRYFTGASGLWTESTTTTWNSVGGDTYIGNHITAQYIHYGNGNEGSDTQRYSYNITSAAKAWANGTHSPGQGLVFKAIEMTEELVDTTNDRLKYFGSYNRSDYRTSFTLQYTDYSPTITLNTYSADILEGATRTLTATTTPAGATVTWSTSNSAVATVSATGVVTAKKAGSATITAQFTDNGTTHTATCTVYVYISNGIYYFNNKSNGYRIQFNNSLSYAENSPLCVANAGTSAPTERYAFFKVEYLGKGLYSIRSMLDNKMGWTRSSTSVLSTTIGTLNSTVPTTAKWYIKYNSDGYYIYSVSGTAYTITSPAAPGSALTLASYASSNALQKWSLNRITTTYNGVEIIDKVNTLIIGESFDLSAVVYSSIAGINGQISMSWSVTNGTGSATIDSTTGELTGISSGTVIVTVTYPYTPSISWTDSCIVLVRNLDDVKSIRFLRDPSDTYTLCVSTLFNGEKYWYQVSDEGECSDVLLLSPSNISWLKECYETFLDSGGTAFSAEYCVYQAKTKVDAAIANGQLYNVPVGSDEYNGLWLYFSLLEANYREAIVLAVEGLNTLTTFINAANQAYIFTLNLQLLANYTTTHTAIQQFSAMTAVEAFDTITDVQAVNLGITDLVPSNNYPAIRPTWRQSEIFLSYNRFTSELGYRYNKSYLFSEGNFVETSYGTAGSIRPDFYNEATKHFVDVKNYTITTSAHRNSLVHNVINQYNNRVNKLPIGTTYEVVIDVRGQDWTQAMLDDVYDRIVQQSGGAIIVTFVK